MAWSWSSVVHGVQYAFDGLALLSVPVYCTVAVLMWRRKTFSWGFTVLAFSLAVADVVYGVGSRFLYIFPNRNWLRFLFSLSWITVFVQLNMIATVCVCVCVCLCTLD